MARSWRNFFRKSTDEEQENGPAVASEPEPAAEDAEEATATARWTWHPPKDVLAEDVPTAEEVQAERKEPTPEDVWEVEEAAPDEVEESLPEPTPVEAEPDADAVAKAQESAGWFGRLRQGLAAAAFRSWAS